MSATATKHVVKCTMSLWW